MLAIAEERARCLGLHGIIDINAENLELGTNQAFYSILCRWGLMFLPDLDKALIKMRDILISGGKLAAAVWSEPSKVPLINMPMSTARQRLQSPLLDQGVPGPFSLADVDALKKS